MTSYKSLYEQLSLENTKLTIENDKLKHLMGNLEWGYKLEINRLRERVKSLETERNEYGKETK